jgi:hypothetical protein
VTAAVVEAEAEPGVAAVVPEPPLAPVEFQAPAPLEPEPAVVAPAVVAAAPTAAPPAAVAAVTDLPWEEQASAPPAEPVSVPPQAEALALQPASIAPPVEAGGDSDDEPPPSSRNRSSRRNRRPAWLPIGWSCSPSLACLA